MLQLLAMALQPNAAIIFNIVG